MNTNILQLKVNKEVNQLFAEIRSIIRDLNLYNVDPDCITADIMSGYDAYGIYADDFYEREFKSTHPALVEKLPEISKRCMKILELTKYIEDEAFV